MFQEGCPEGPKWGLAWHGLLMVSTHISSAELAAGRTPGKGVDSTDGSSCSGHMLPRRVLEHPQQPCPENVLTVGRREGLVSRDCASGGGAV